MSLKVEVPADQTKVSVLDLPAGTLFTYDQGGLGLRVDFGWLVLDGQNVEAWIDGEFDPPSFAGLDDVCPRPDMEALIKISKVVPSE